MKIVARGSGSHSPVAVKNAEVAHNGFNRQTLLVVKRKDGTTLHRHTLLVNFDTDLSGLVSTLQFSLQSSPADPLVPLDKLSYRTTPSNSRNALDATPFAASRDKKGSLVKLDEASFNRELFVPMKKVYLFAVGEAEEEEVVNDENNRRLSNGSMPSNSPVGGGDRNGSPSRSVSPASPPSLKNRRGGAPSRDARKSCESGWESSWDPVVNGTDIKPILTGAVLTTKASSSAFQGAGHDSNNADYISPLGSPSSAGREKLASPAPGRRSKLFRRASLLPRPSMISLDDDDDDDEDGDDDSCSGTSNDFGARDVAVADKSTESGTSPADGHGDDSTTDNSSLGRTGGLSPGAGKKRGLGRREAVSQQRQPQHRPIWRERDSSKGSSTMSGNSRRVGGSSATGAGGSDTSRSVSGAGQLRGKVEGKVEGSAGEKRKPKTALFENSDKTSTPKVRRRPTPKKAQHQSAWAAPPSERRQVLLKASGTPKGKLPTRPVVISTTPKAQAGRGGFTSPSPSSHSRAKSPRPKVEDDQGGRAVQDEEGEGGGERGSTGRGALPPRVSVGFSWERGLRTVSKTPVKKPKVPQEYSPGTKSAIGRVLRKGGKGVKGRGVRGDGGGGRGGTGEGGRAGGKDGRPSIGTWTKTQNYLQILKELSGKDEEELEWLAVAKKGHGVIKSEQRRESAETEYHRLLCEESIQQAGLKMLQDRRLEVALRAVGKLGKELKHLGEVHEEMCRQEQELVAEDVEAEAQEAVDAEIAAEREAVASQEGGVEAAAAVMAEAERAVEAAATARATRQEQRGRLVDSQREAELETAQVLGEIGKAQQKLRVVQIALREEAGEGVGDGGSAITTIVGIAGDVCSAQGDRAPDRASSGLRSIEDAAKSLHQELNKTRSNSQSALARMEKWRERKEALPEYEKEIADKEQSWFSREKKANEDALRRMRALCPVGVTGFTVAQLEERAREAGSLYPRELALRLKENRLIHWTVEHPDDIARSNFLRGDHAHFFTNLDRYDLVELRAITACLPERFEVDGDGRKAAWRALFLQRVQGLVAQEQADTVSGGWDPETGGRRVVKLPPLTADQARRPEYFYPTREEVDEKIEKLRERQRRLNTKRAKLTEINDVLLPEARQEYANVLADTRHPANKEIYSAEDLRRARDEARAEVDRLSKEVKRFEADVASAERALANGPYTAESLQAEADATKALLLERVNKRRLLARQKEESEAKKQAGENEDADRAGALKATREGAHGCPEGLADGAAEKTAGDVDDADVLGDQVASAAMGSALQEEGDKEQKGREEEEENKEQEEGLEVEGPFDGEPELRSRFADKSSSLRFVTAEEEARMRKEELAKVFGERGPVETVQSPGSSTVGGGGGGGEGSMGNSQAATGAGQTSTSNALDVSGVAKDIAVEASGGQISGAPGGSGTVKGRMKAMGAILEKTLSQSILVRVPPPGTAAASTVGGAPANPRGGLAGRRQFSSQTRHDQGSTVRSNKAEKTRTLSPPCKPKSKFFRSIRPPSEANVAPAREHSAAPQVRSPPPPPMLGLLSQIRGARGGDGEAKVIAGGLLAQIRATKEGNNGVTHGPGGVGQEKDLASSGPPAPPPPPPPPPLSLQPRSLFGAAEKGGPPVPRGPPPDFFAALRAKAIEKQALRRAAGDQL